jgi:hypothetical protein
MKEQIDSGSSMNDRTDRIRLICTVCLADVAIADKTEIQTYLLYAPDERTDSIIRLIYE